MPQRQTVQVAGVVLTPVDQETLRYLVGLPNVPTRRQVAAEFGLSVTGGRRRLDRLRHAINRSDDTVTTIPDVMTWASRNRADLHRVLFGATGPLLVSGLESPHLRYYASAGDLIRYYPRRQQDETRHALEQEIDSSSAPHFLYIAAAMLHSMGPWLGRGLSTADTGVWLKEKLLGVRVKRISWTLLRSLAELRLVSSDFLPTLEANLLTMRENAESAGLEYAEAVWEAFPPFHGTLFGDLITIAPWETDFQGYLTPFTSQIVMKREHDPAVFDAYRARLINGFMDESG